MDVPSETFREAYLVEHGFVGAGAPSATEVTVDDSGSTFDAADGWPSLYRRRTCGLTAHSSSDETMARESPGGGIIAIGVP